MKTFEGKLVSKEIKIGIVAARFNEFITSKLLEGAKDGLLRHDVSEENIAMVEKAKTELIGGKEVFSDEIIDNAVNVRFSKGEMI